MPWVHAADRNDIWSRGERASGDSSAVEKFFAARTLTGRFNELEEVAQAVFFLASPWSSGMTAAEIVVDGGCLGSPWGYKALQG